MGSKPRSDSALALRLRRWGTFWSEFSRDRAAVVSLFFVAIVVVIALAAPLLPLADPKEFSGDQYASPSREHPMGTDNFGRSMLSRVIWGARLGLTVGVVAAGISMTLGIILGGNSGYFGGWVDDVLSRGFDIFMLIPAFFLAMLMIALFGPNILFIMLVIGITMWPRSARIMRAQVLTLKERVFVQATRSSGASHLQALFIHVMPNGLGPVITHGTILMGSAILIEAGLSFLGLGDPNTVSWGRMIFEGQAHLRIAPWMSFFPGLAMLLVVCALNLMGDGLNRAVNPHLQERRRGTRLKIPKILGSEQAAPATELDGIPIPEDAALQPANPGTQILTSPRSDPEMARILASEPDPILFDVRDLTMFYGLEDAWLRAADGVSLQLDRGDSLGLVGESGCGKTSVGLTLMRVLPRNARVLGGNVFLGGDEVLRCSEADFKQVRWNRMSMIFQSSMNSLNPVKRSSEQLVDAYQLHRPEASEQEALDRVKELFEIVHIPTDRMRSFPHELSGGMRQRVMIALALLLDPEVIIADEPTTALDVLVQDQILAELIRLREEMDLAMILISHDVGIIAETCERIAVMYAGYIVEEAPSRELFGSSRHPYTRGLLGSLPTLTGPRKELIALPGESTPVVGEPLGCRFADRCPLAVDLCRNEDPPVLSITNKHWSRCHFAEEDFVQDVWQSEKEVAHA
jgi:peptide/nickel transport system permease protein